MNNYVYLIMIIGIVALLFLAVMIRYSQSGEGEFSLFNWIKLKFKGKNKDLPISKNQIIGIKMAPGSQIIAKEVIGGDKITLVDPSKKDIEKKPNIDINIFTIGRVLSSSKEISFVQREGDGWNIYPFGLVLENREENTTAKGVGVRLIFSWRGALPQRKIIVSSPEISGWVTSVDAITNDQSAIITYSNSETIAFYNQPVEWKEFTIKIASKLDGFILVEYKVSTLQPQTYSSGELIIKLS